MISVRAIYDGQHLQLMENVFIDTPKNVIITFLDNETQDLTSTEMHAIAINGGSFDFLNNTEEDVYTDADLKIKYPKK